MSGDINGISKKDLILFVHQDLTNLIQQGKQHRWDIVKWIVGLNVIVWAIDDSKIPIIGDDKEILIFFIGMVGVILYLANERELVHTRKNKISKILYNYSWNIRTFIDDAYGVTAGNYAWKFQKLDLIRNSFCIVIIILTMIPGFMALVDKLMAWFYCCPNIWHGIDGYLF